MKGLAQLNRKLRAIPQVVEAEIKAAMAKGADEVVALAKSLVPVDDGDLRDSIEWTWGDAPSGALAIASAGDGNLRITIYAGDEKAFYARWVEFGTAQHPQGGMFKGATHPGTTAQPFFYPSWRALRRRVKSRLTRAMNKAAKRISGS